MNPADEKKLLESRDGADLDSLVSEIYAELKRLAAYHLKNERLDHTLRPTELVHEVYLRMLEQRAVNLDDRAYFVSLASTMMRRVLVNYAKRRNRQKRGAGADNVSLDATGGKTLIAVEQNQVDVIALEEALLELGRRDARQVKIVDLHFYGGLTFEEISQILGVSLRSTMREWRFARSWLYRHLNNGQAKTYEG